MSGFLRKRAVPYVVEKRLRYMYNIYVQEFEYCMTQKTDHEYVICILIYTLCIGNNILIYYAVHTIYVIFLDCISDVFDRYILIMESNNDIM